LKVFTLNCGSSSIKFQVVDPKKDEKILKGSLTRIPVHNSVLSINGNEIEVDVDEHSGGLDLILEKLEEKNILEEINAVGHRVVHGGEKFKEPVIVTDEILDELEKLSFLAPLHNPHNVKGIEICREKLPEIPDVAVFDTSFHQSMDEKAYLYGIPYRFYRDYSVRKYGFHGTSHRFVAKRTAKMMNKEIKDINIVTCHLGNGASVTAVKEGESMDTSMGFTPLEGLVMGTRSGDIDPAIIPFIMEKEGITSKEVEEILNKESGLKGLSEGTSNFKELIENAEKGDKKSERAINVFKYRLKKYIGAYSAAMNGIDAIAFTGGIGENAVELRRNILEDLEYLGFEIDYGKNKIRGEKMEITRKNSEKKAFVIPTDEELEIAKETIKILR